MNLKDIKVFIDDTQRTIQRTLDRLTLSREDIRLQMRAARMQNLVLRGDSATSEEIFTADFGTRHPKGLDVTYPDHDQRIVSFDKSERFQVRHENEKANDKRTTYGMAFGEEEVAINDGFYQETDWKKASLKLSGTVAHEHIHCLQAADISNGWEEAMTTVNMTFVIAPVVEDDLEGRVKGIYRDMRRAADHVIKRWEANDLQNIFKVQSSNEFTEGYLAQDCEMQARLHEVLAQGYAIWQQMPATKTELWAALHNCGLRTPDSVMAELRNSEDGQASLKKFAISSSNRAKFDLGSTEQLNEVFNYAALPERRDILWKHVYPNLYGNLLELYGDGPGRERMGLGPNPRAAKALMRQFIHAPDSLTGETLPELVKDIQPENAAQLMNLSLIHI